MYHQRFGILCGECALISFLPAPTYTKEEYLQSHCAQSADKPMKRLDMRSGARNVWARWLKEDRRNVEQWKWRLELWWHGPFGTPGTGFALWKNNSNQRTSFRVRQLFYRTIRDGSDTWLNHDKQPRTLLWGYYTISSCCNSFLLYVLYPICQRERGGLIIFRLLQTL